MRCFYSHESAYTGGTFVCRRLTPPPPERTVRMECADEKY